MTRSCRASELSGIAVRDGRDEGGFEVRSFRNIEPHGALFSHVSRVTRRWRAFFSILLDSLARHEQIRLIDRLDFLHRHVELKSQFNQVPPRVMHLPVRN
jgi:hypothetical protein